MRSAHPQYIERVVGFRKSAKLEAVFEAVNIFNQATPHHKDHSIQASHLEICRMDINHCSQSFNLHARYVRQLPTICLYAQHFIR